MRVLIDQLLELLVVPSFTRLGFAVRSRLFRWRPAESDSLAGRTIVITGPTSGLGREAASSFARMGARLVLVGRDAERLEATAGELRDGSPGAEIAWVVADMASLESVHNAVGQILERAPRIDVIVDNAGAMFAERGLTPEGFERTFATMVLGPFVLVAGLLPRLLESPDPRIVAVASGGMYAQALPLEDLQFERGEYQGARAYARAKRAQVALIREWSRRLLATGPAGRGAGGRRVRRERDASGLGRHSGARGVLARLSPADRRLVAEPGGGRRHDDLAGRFRRGTRRDRSAVPRSPEASVRSNPIDSPDGGRSARAVGSRARPDRRSRPDSPVGGRGPGVGSKPARRSHDSPVVARASSAPPVPMSRPGRIS